MTYKEYDELGNEVFENIYFDDEYLERFGYHILDIPELKNNTFYVGNCRNSEIAFWNGEEFFYQRSAWPLDDLDLEKINHIYKEENEMIDAFCPIEEITDLPNEIVTWFKEKGFTSDC